MIAEDFSEGYYQSQFYVRPSDNDPTINIEDFHDIQYDIYDPGTHRDTVMCKLDTIYFEVEPGERTASGVLELPTNIIDLISLSNPPTKRTVLIVKPWVADYLSWSFPRYGST